MTQHGKQQRQISYPNISTDSGETVASLRNGLDRCADLLAAIMESPDVSQRQKLNQKHLSKNVKIRVSPPTATIKSSMRHATPYNKRLVASTPVYEKPICLNSSSKTEAIETRRKGKDKEKQMQYEKESKFDFERLIQEKKKLEDKLKTIEYDKNVVEKKYQALLQGQHDIDRNEDVTRDISAAVQTFHNRNESNSPHKGYSAPINQYTATIHLPNKLISRNSSSPRENVIKKPESHAKETQSKKNRNADTAPYEMRDTLSCEARNSSVELESLVERISGNLTNPLLSVKKLKPLYNETSIVKPNLVTPLASSVEDLQIPSYQSSVRASDSQAELTQRKIQSKRMTDTKNKKKRTAEEKEIMTTDFKSDNSPLAVQVTTLSYLIAELRNMTGEKIDLEAHRLFDEIDHIIGILPFIIEKYLRSKQGEDPSGFQHVLMENNELRRQVAAIDREIQEFISQVHSNELMKEKEMREDFEVLERKLQQEELSKNRLVKEVQDIQEVTEELRTENEALLKLLSDREAKQIEERQGILIHESSRDKEITEYQAIIDELRLTVEVSEKECKIKEMALRQRDAEVERLNRLNSDLQESVSKLLADLKQERIKYNYKLPEFEIGYHECGSKDQEKENSNSQQEVERFTTPDLNTNDHPTSMNQFSPISSISSEPSILVATHLISQLKDSSVSTLKTCDNSEFLNGLNNLDHEIFRIQKSLKVP